MEDAAFGQEQGEGGKHPNKTNYRGGKQTAEEQEKRKLRAFGQSEWSWNEVKTKA